MKLTKLHIENFRSLRNVTWEPGDLNVLIGPNAGGKSNLLKAIEFLAAAAKGELREHVAQNGGISSIAWNNSAESIDFRADVGGLNFQDTLAGSIVTFDFVLKRLVKSREFVITHEFLSVPTVNATPVDEYLLARDTHMAKIDRGYENTELTASDYEGDESVLRFALHPRNVGPAAQFARYLAGWTPYQGFRTDVEASSRGSDVSRREPVLRSNGANLVNVLHTLYSDNSSFESDVNDAMNAAFGDEFVKLVFSPDAADQRIQLKVRWKSLENPVPSWDLSDGTLRFLYLLAILANPNPPPLVAIDEPETGLHPRMISIIAEFAAEAARRTQLICTTQSSEFLDAITPFEPVTTVVEARNSETSVRNIPKEQLDHWLKGYTLGELFRTNGLETVK
jgi:predicted ATPase